MIKKAHVSFDGEVLRPDESLELKANTRYIITIESEEATSIKNAWDVLDELTGTVKGPEDWSSELDHYLYNVPKRNKRRKDGL